MPFQTWLGSFLCGYLAFTGQEIASDLEEIQQNFLYRTRGTTNLNYFEVVIDLRDRSPLLSFILSPELLSKRPILAGGLYRLHLEKLQLQAEAEKQARFNLINSLRSEWYRLEAVYLDALAHSSAEAEANLQRRLAINDEIASLYKQQEESNSFEIAKLVNQRLLEDL